MTATERGFNGHFRAEIALSDHDLKCRVAQMSRDKLYGESTGPQSLFRFHCETLFSRSSLHRFEIGLHRHESFLQILYISGGDGDATLEGAVTPIQPPAVIIVPPGFEHGFRFSRDIAGLIITLIPSALSTLLQTVTRQHLARPVLIPLEGHDALGEVVKACELISQEFAGNRLARDAMIEGQIASLIAHLCRIDRASAQQTGADRNGNRFEMLLNLIERHIRDHKSAAFYAQQLGMSQTHLNRLVRQQCGTSLQRLIARRQLEIAQQELLFTVSTVQMVATGLGFVDPSYFSRFFVRETGMTPGAWRSAEQSKFAATPSPEA